MSTLRALLRAAFAASSCVFVWVSAIAGLAACGSDPPQITLRVNEGSTPISGLSRLQLIVRECGARDFAVFKDLLAGGQRTSTSLDGAIAPGRTFYAWVKAWQTCVPSGGACVPEENADARDCMCIQGGPNQTIVSEACTMWMPAENGRQATLTLRPLPPVGTKRDCPPDDLVPCP